MPDTTPTTPAVWSDTDPLMQAIAAAVWEQCATDLAASITCDDPRTIAAVAATVARLVLGTTDQQPTTADRRERYRAAIRETDGWVLDDGQHMLDAVMAVADEETRKLRHKFGVLGGDYDNIKAAAEAHRLAVSEALGLGTGAPWDAIRDRAAELHRATAPVDRVTVLREAADAALTMPTPDCAEMSSLTGAWRAGLWAAVDCLRRMADEAQPATDQHEHTWVTALDGDDLPALDEHGRTWTHCGTCGTKRTPDERREPHPTEVDMAHALTLLNHRPAADRPDTETEAACTCGHERHGHASIDGLPVRCLNCACRTHPPAP